MVVRRRARRACARRGASARSSCVGSAAGRRLTLLHGFPSSSYDWAAVAPALAARRTLLMPDFLGFGASAEAARARLLAARAGRPRRGAVGARGHRCDGRDRARLRGLRRRGAARAARRGRARGRAAARPAAQRRPVPRPASPAADADGAARPRAGPEGERDDQRGAVRRGARADVRGGLRRGPRQRRHVADDQPRRRRSRSCTC